MKTQIPAETNPHLRCRDNLAPTDGHQVTAVGYLSQVSQNRGLKERLAKHHNALLMDVHIIKDDTTKQIVQLNVDHIHCQVGNLQLKPYLEKYFVFSATVYSYTSQYKKKQETRYGLKNIALESQSKATLKTLNHYYLNHLSFGQEVLLKRAKQMAASSGLKVASETEITKRVLNIGSLNNKTQFLDTVIDKLYNGRALSNSQSDKFTAGYTNNETVKDSLLTELRHNLANTQIELTKVKTKNQLLERENKELSHLSRDQAHLISQQKPTSLWQAIVTYYKQKYHTRTVNTNSSKPHYVKSQTKKESTSNVSDDQLAKLQAKFNNK